MAVDAKPLLAAEAKKNQRLGGDPSTFLKNDKPRTSIKPVHVEKSVASQFDVSQGYVYAAQKIKEKDEKVFQEVKSGALSIPDAERKLGLKDSGPVSSESN